MGDFKKYVGKKWETKGCCFFQMTADLQPGESSIFPWQEFKHGVEISA